ncbi:dienelactone hydrolase family protein [Mycobacterium sp. 21AC1]|uniref:dienelactone hydrolase family protein n=1 Tax=[Mycobacterium] appelbergii TaxID=2939269 RepID=UPI002939324C|nr:dienelactone hydrolase family protein [Mycobacterium sp. 21AC1]MDV3128366.1 dienelactone hydrolase family protein [Mycobacterium sp. 21AC1]
MELHSIEYDCAGTVLTGYLAVPDVVDPVAGVLVAHEATGMNDHVKSRARALAHQGYAAFALDLYGTTGFPRAEAEARTAHLMETPGLLLDRAMAALRTLEQQPAVDADRLGAIGFCLGGITALELARAGAQIKCAIGFHPGLVRPTISPDGPITAKVLMMSGSEDPHAPENLRARFADEMSAKGADWQLHLFGGVGHTFTDPMIDALNIPGFGYDANADHRSWTMALSLLSETLRHRSSESTESR